MLAGGGGPISAAHPIPHILDKFLLATLSDKIARQRIPLSVKWEYVRRIFRHHKHAIKSYSSSRTEKLNQEFFLFGSLVPMFDRRASAFIGPAGQGPTKIGSENRVRYFVRQDGIQDTSRGSLNGHSPTKRTAILEHKAGGSAGAKVGADLNCDRAGLRPAR